VEGERKEDRQRDEDVRLALPLAVHSLNRSGDKLGERERKKKGRCTIFCEIIGDLHKIIKYWRWDDRQPQIIDPKAHIQC
jgi:hypothetical protein